MMQIKALVAAAACAFVLPVLAAESTTETAKAVDKAKAEAKAEAKKPAAEKEKVAGQVAAPVVTKDSVEKGNGATQPEPYTLRNERWVPKDDRS